LDAPVTAAESGLGRRDTLRRKPEAARFDLFDDRQVRL